ncbi:hypothetical protein N8152_03245, partial [bacterium]|nr:hypothetical protein [bacterium]
GAAAAARDVGFVNGTRQSAPANNQYYGQQQYQAYPGMYAVDGKTQLAPDPSAAAKQASRLSSFFTRAPVVGGNGLPLMNTNSGKKNQRPSVSFDVGVEGRSSLFSPPPGANKRGGDGLNNDTAAAAAALLRSPEWIAQLSMATMGAPIMHAPSPSGVGVQTWASPATVAPLQALYAWYSGNAGAVGKTNGQGYANRTDSELQNVHTSGGAAVSGLSGLSSLFDGSSPAEVEAAMHRETMHAAAAAAVHAAMGGVTAGNAMPIDLAVFAKAQERALQLNGMAESTRRL